MKHVLSTKNNSIKKIIFILTTFLILVSSQSYSQEITGLSGWSIYIDPGHSQNENVGIYGYSEAKKNLRVGLNLQQMLTEWTDIDTAYICRTNDQQSVTLSQRTDEANLLGAAHYHSIHSDAGGSTANSTLIMWGNIGIGGPEKTPYGGKKMSNIMVGLLTAGMRTNTRGAWPDRDFYYSIDPINTANNPWPYLHVNRETTMASELSEAGFHTNPTQNQLNMNDKWKRLEAKTMFWTILKYHDIPRPFAGTVAGIIKDIESGQPINGATVTFDGQSYTTDTYQSLFYNYSSDPEQLRNGFYYFENVPSGTHQLQVSAEGYDLYTADVTMADTFFTFKDVNLISNIPFKVTSTDPIMNDSLYPGKKNITINFSKPVNPTTLDQNLIISPGVFADYNLSNSNKSLIINTNYFENNTDYQINLIGNLEDNYGHKLDGNGDGIAGDNFVLNITTSVVDIIPPVVQDLYPNPSATGVELKPIISVSFNELLNTTTISNGIKIIMNSDQSNVTPPLRTQYVINGRSVVNYFVRAPLTANESYTIQILPGLQDEFGNSIQSEIDYQFTTGNLDYSPQTIIDNFDSNIDNSWYQPEQSGSTVGIIPLLTNFLFVTTIRNLGTPNNIGSVMFDYAYDTTATNFLIREYRTVSSTPFGNSGLLQVFIFGDGNSNKFRFCVRETNGSSPTNLEVSPWYDINWIGWKIVTWDLSEGQTGSWLGNGILEPPFIFDSFQFTYDTTYKNNIGKYYLDDLRTATFSLTDVKKENDQIPNDFVLEQNYPNPFNSSTQIKFSVPQSSNVKLIVTDILGKEVATLVNDNLNTGNYSVNFDADALSSGVYFYTLITDNFKQSRKMILMK